MSWIKINGIGGRAAFLNTEWISNIWETTDGKTKIVEAGVENGFLETDESVSTVMEKIIKAESREER